MIKSPFARNVLIRNAIWSAIYARMKVDPRIYCLGEGAGMKVHYDAPEIEREFPERVLTLPISEDGNSNFAVGMALAGLVPVVDVIVSDFGYRTMDSICNTAAKMAEVGPARTVVFRMEFFTAGPTTGQRTEALFTHIPGLNVVVPSNPADAYGLMASALEHPGVTVFFEDRMIADATTSEDDSHYLVSLGEAVQQGGPYLVDPEMWKGLEPVRFAGPLPARTRNPGSRLTVVSYGLTLRQLDGLLAGKDYELIDLRTLYPLDMATVVASVRRTHALLFVEPDVQHGGVGAEVVAAVAEAVPGCRVARLGAPRVGIPASHDLQHHMLPSDQQILARAAELAYPDGEQWA